MTASIGIAFTGRGARRRRSSPRRRSRHVRSKRDRRARPATSFDLRELHLAEHQAGLAQACPARRERGELHLEYQPIVDAADGRLTGVEALLRWTHPTRGPVPPTVFIPLAEQSGQIVDDRAVGARAGLVRTGGGWQTGRTADDRRSRSTSRRTSSWPPASPTRWRPSSTARRPTRAADPGGDRERLRPRRRTRPDRARRAQGTRREARPRRLRHRLLVARATSSRCRSTSSRSTRSFIANLERATRPATTIVAAIIQLAHSLGMTVVAEGVETAEQHESWPGSGPTPARASTSPSRCPPPALAP